MVEWASLKGTRTTLGPSRPVYPQTFSQSPALPTSTGDPLSRVTRPAFCGYLGAIMEIELKLILEADEVQRLRAGLAAPLREVDQLNHYFDDRNRSLGRAGWGVRIREESGGDVRRALLTVKHSGVQKGEFIHRPENETSLSLQRCAEWLECPAAMFDAVVQLSPALGEFGALELEQVGSMQNRRAVFALPAAPQFSIELDRTTWPDASVGWEVELEITEDQSAAEAEAALRALLSSLDIHWRCGQESKLARLMRMLGTQGQ